MRYLPYSFGPSLVSTPTGWIPEGGISSVIWGAVAGAAGTWASQSSTTLGRWADLTPSTYTSYAIGTNFVITANEQYPMYAEEDRPLVVPPDSGYSKP